MRARSITTISVILIGVVIALAPAIAQPEQNPARQLAGLWEAKRRFGPDVRGTLLVRQSNGGQTVMGIPELDLVIAIYAGNYADSPSGQISQGYVPKYILPAVSEAER